jgi:tetratricopeptide (TPR) repeat protein
VSVGDLSAVSPFFGDFDQPVLWDNRTDSKWISIVPSDRRQCCNSILISLTALLLIGGCTNAQTKSDFDGLLKSSATARSIGHEDLAANDLKEAFDSLPPNDDPKRVQRVNQLYPQLLALAADLKKSGRLSLSNTMYEKAMAIEAECTLADKPSATALRKETDEVFAQEEKILATASNTPDLRLKEKEFRNTSEVLKKLFAKGEYRKVETEGLKHSESVRALCGTDSALYDEARKVYIDTLLVQDKLAPALALLERDLKELDTFSEDDLKNADADAIQNAFFLCSTLCEIAQLKTIIGELDEAEKTARRSLRLVNILGGRMVLETALSQIVLADVLMRKGQNQEALVLARSSYKLLATIKSTPSDQIRAMRMIAVLENLLGQKDLAKRDFSNLANLFTAYPRIRESWISFAVAAAYYRAQGDKQGFLRLKDRAIKATLSKNISKFDVLTVFETLGDSAFQASEFSEALSFYEKALQYSSNFRKEELERKIERSKKEI